MKTTIAPLLVSLLCFATCRAQPSPEPETLTPKSVSERFSREVKTLHDAFLQDVNKLEKAYLAALLKAESAAKGRSDLDLVLAIRAEIERVESTPAAAAADLSELEALAALQRIWNDRLAKRRRQKQRDHRALSLRIADFTEQRIKPTLQGGDLDTAVAWRDLTARISEQTPEAVPEEEPASDSPIPAGIMPLHSLTIWNQHNAGHNDRGATRLNIQAFHKGNRVWEKQELPIDWEPDADKSLKVTFRSLPVDEIRVSIEEFQKKGGGLSEIVLEINGRPRKPSSANASAQYDKRFSPGRVIDGITTSSKFAKGYWLLPGNQKGWIRIQYK